MRLIAGFTSALALVYAVGALLSGLRRPALHLIGWDSVYWRGIVFSGLRERKVGHRPTTRENSMQTRTLGKTGLAVSGLGLGAMGMSGVYGAADRAESIGAVHAALAAGVTLIDTGDCWVSLGWWGS
ncbi:hypothetical protein RB614_36890 [Phytohabitans sp. ZYX-F-186]|uniref:NADP-dependent oxidoreductase domain-containing protein n=1 Tax=Phytohabitans maris TaxID=3071409 RepID=A0ABU0ZT03_9ACTN|nr:aldo/keto reductase [Phytohabitans sp. ZYX-F-186]MDQ7910088.1 hypothetical protein [Phytohabitans sp. ZYX-F-186]